MRTSIPSASDSTETSAPDLAQLGDRVDERDLRREEGVGARPDQLGGLQIGHHHRCAVGDRRGVHRSENRFGARGSTAEAESVRSERVVEGPTFAEELGVPDEFGADPVRGRLTDDLPESGGRSDEHGRLADDDPVMPQARGDRARGRLDRLQIRRPALGRLGRSDADEVDVRGCDGFGDVRHETQSAAGHVSAQELGKSRFVERRLTRGEGGESRGVGVDADDA